MLTILFGILALQIKHVVADYYAQTSYMVINKATYGHFGGILHSGVHAVLSLGVLLALGVPIGAAALICGAEFIVHYHIDWSKEAIAKRIKLTPTNVGFWRLHGTDQALHQATYLGMIGWLACAGHLT